MILWYFNDTEIHPMLLLQYSKINIPTYGVTNTLVLSENHTWSIKGEISPLKL